MSPVYNKERLNIEQLDLDLSNPRVNGASSQQIAMREILAVEGEGEKVYALALSICTLGDLDPGDRLYVVENPATKGIYTVLDGNRRLTALRLLNQPALVDRDELRLSSQLRSRFKRLHTKYAGAWPTSVDVVIFETRDAARELIRLRHTGENSGAGRSAWSALQIARFDDTSFWRAIGALRDMQALSLKAVNQLDRSDYAITNFGRVAGTAQFQERFSVNAADMAAHLAGVDERGILALAKLANDVAAGLVTSRGVFEKEETMGAYLDALEDFVDSHLQKNGASEKEAKSQRRNAASDSGGQSSSSHDAAEGGEAQRHGSEHGKAHDGDRRDNPNDGRSADADPTDRSRDEGGKPKSAARKARKSAYLISKKTMQSVTDLKCRAFVDELQSKIRIEHAPYGCALLVRSLIEITTTVYVRDVVKDPQSNAVATIDRAVKHLRSDPSPVDPADWREIAENLIQASTEYRELSRAAHNQRWEVSPDHVRATWSRVSGGLDLMWRRIRLVEEGIAGQRPNAKV